MSNLKIAILRVGIYKTCIPITYCILITKLRKIKLS